MSQMFKYKYQCLWHHLNTHYLNRKVKVDKVIKELKTQYDIELKTTTTYHYLKGLSIWGFINENIPKYTSYKLEIKLLRIIPENFKTSHFDKYFTKKEQTEFIEKLKVESRKQKIKLLFNSIEFNKHINYLNCLKVKLDDIDNEKLDNAINYFKKLK